MSVTNNSIQPSSKTTANWSCTICNSDESFPMMIKLCGHTFCEDCLDNVQECPVCRMRFGTFDLQPNYYLYSGVNGNTSSLNGSGAGAGVNAQSDRRVRGSIDQKIKDLIRIKKEQINSHVNKIIETLVDQLHDQLLQSPELISYVCQLPKSTTVELLKLVDERLKRHGLLMNTDVGANANANANANPNHDHNPGQSALELNTNGICKVEISFNFKKAKINSIVGNEPVPTLVLDNDITSSYQPTTEMNNLLNNASTIFSSFLSNNAVGSGSYLTQIMESLNNTNTTGPN